MKKIIIFFILICASFSLWAQTSEDLRQLRSQANMGNAEAQFQLGWCYEYGIDGLLSPDFNKAIEWYKKSAEKGFAPAQCILGGCYEMGIDGVIASDPNEAVKWYKKSAEQEYAEAQLYLGNSYMSGFGSLTQSESEAVKWWKKSAEQGFLQAQIALGTYYKNSANRSSALYWFEKAKANIDANKKDIPKEMQAEFNENYVVPIEKEINELKKPVSKTATYLTTSTNSLNFNSYGSTSTITVSTDGNSYEVSYLPSWCSVINKTTNFFKIVCQSNSGDTRTDWFKVKSDDKEVRINIEQAAGVKVPSAKFENIWVVHNVLENQCNIYSRKGMQIHIKFSVDGMLNKRGNCVVWFYFSNGSELTDYNNLYKTTTGKVATSSKFKSTYENSIWNDFVIFMPYDELHLSRGSHSLKFKIGLFDQNDKQIVTSEETHFSYTSW